MDKKNIEKLLVFIKNSKDIVSDEAYKEIWHYFEHGEFEMAFEGLLIELITENRYPNGFEKATWINLGVEFGLDKDSVFDTDIWKKFIFWSEKE